VLVCLMCSFLSAHFNIYREFVREREFVTYLLTQQRISCAHIHLYVSRVRKREGVRDILIDTKFARERGLLMYTSCMSGFVRCTHLHLERTTHHTSLRHCSRSLSPVCVYIGAVCCRVLACSEVFAHPASRSCMCTLLQRVAACCSVLQWCALSRLFSPAKYHGN